MRPIGAGRYKIKNADYCFLLSKEKRSDFEITHEFRIKCATEGRNADVETAFVA